MSSVRLDSTTQDKLRQIAARKGISVSEVHREALSEYLEREFEATRKSRYSDMIGIADSGRTDLSTNHKQIFCEILDEKYANSQERGKEASE
ncbi:MAG: Ribbon-helix-helix protein copG family [Capsulimonas sp.]|nr:Ribbon-helix-helix protein copG family [Capsulimonas sp.]